SKERPVADSIAARLTRPTAYNFKTDCMILWNAEERDVVPPGDPTAMLAIDGAGFDWNYMAVDEVPTHMALMAFQN
ncbi:hypothetical protein Tco_0386653, partial [Tanacetum coccineum]